MKDLKITLVQAELQWESPSENLKHFSGMLKKVRKGSTHLIVLPEMFATGFTMNARKVAQTMEGAEIKWMLDLAKAKKAVVCGSLVIREGKKFFNRLVWAQPDGAVLHYDKRHLFRMAQEDKTYSAGKKRLVVQLNGWSVFPLVCYDLRFPVWSRSKGDIDLMLFVANWPERRKYAWKHLLIARAIENQCYVAGLNRVGKDGENIVYTGDSVVLDPLGMPLSSIRPGIESVITVSLSYRFLAELRKNFPVSLDRDKFKII